MDAQQQIATWFVATIAPFCLNAIFKRDPDAIGLAGMIIVGWCFERVCWVVWTPPEAMQLYPLMDLAFGLTTLTAWGTRPVWWKMALAAVFLFQCCVHTAFWFAYPTDAPFVIRYVAVLNYSYALELILAASSGLGHALAVLGRALLPHRSDLRHHASP